MRVYNFGDSAIPARPEIRNSDAEFRKLIPLYRPFISRTASSFPRQWRTDFNQVGLIELYRVFEKSWGKIDKDTFRQHAFVSIKSRMIDFYRKTIERAPTIIELPATDIDGYQEDYIYNFPDGQNWALSIAKKIDFEFIFSQQNLTAIGLSAKEITVFKMYFIDKFLLAEISATLDISQSQTSKILKKLRKECRQLHDKLNNTNNPL